MYCFLEQKPDKNYLLQEEMNRFWKIETISKSEENVIYQFQNQIQFNALLHIVIVNNCTLNSTTYHL